ncbi:MAG: SDR family oxidoreductase [Gemmatimonadales bacterium]
MRPIGATDMLPGGVMQGKVCLVTGSTRGIGLATADALAARGATVLLHGRNGVLGQQVRDDLTARYPAASIELYIADLAVQAEVRRLADEVRANHKRLDVLINNAGAFFMRRTTTADGIEATFQVNHLSYFQLTNELLSVITASAPARIINLASEAHERVTDPEDWESRKGYNGITAYSRSKLANVMFTYDLAHRIEGSGVTVNCVHPGRVKTRLLQAWFDRWWSRWAWPIAERFLITPEEGAAAVVYLATSLDVAGVTGKYFKQQRPSTSSLVSHDAVIGARLWNISLRMTGELPEITITGEIIAAP